MIHLVICCVHFGVLGTGVGLLAGLWRTEVTVSTPTIVHLLKSAPPSHSPTPTKALPPWLDPVVQARVFTWWEVQLPPEGPQ